MMVGGFLQDGNWKAVNNESSYKIERDHERVRFIAIDQTNEQVWITLQSRDDLNDFLEAVRELEIAWDSMEAETEEARTLDQG